jgi:hypothetical protein
MHIDRKREVGCDDEQSFECARETRRADNLHRLCTAGVTLRQKQSRHTRDVVAVHVTDKQQIDVFDAPSELPQADLSAFTAVEQNQMPRVAQEHAGQAPIGQRHHPACTNQRHIEHVAQDATLLTRAAGMLNVG